MVTTKDLLDLLKEQLGSDYKTAKALGVTTQRISQLRTRGGVFTDEQGLKVSEILGFPAETIILSLAAERSINSPAFGILSTLADKYDPRKIAAVAAVFALSLLSHTAPVFQPFIA
ncbi:MAG: hypothetical protein WA987_09090 [Cellvibrio sp.]